MNQLLSDETRAVMRKQAAQAMMSSLWEYCPSEFLMLLDEYELLVQAIDRCPQDVGGDINTIVKKLRLAKMGDGNEQTDD